MSGFSQTSRWQLRWSRAIWSPQLPRVPAIPPVRDEQDHRTAVQDAAAPALMELLDGSANPRPSRPVGHRPRHRREGVVGSRRAQLSGDSRELGGEEERLDTAVAPRHGVSEVQEHAGVALHGSADVAQQHERARAHASCPSPEFHHVAARAEAVGDRTSKIDSRAAPSNPPPCPAFTRIPDETRQRRARLGYFVGS